MLFRGCLFALLFFNVGQSFGETVTWVLHGRVVDQEAHPVEGVSVATVWNANGVTREQLHNFQKDEKVHPELTMNEGRMEPWGNAPTKTDADGNFSIELRSSREHKLLAIDKERKRGALILVDPRTPPSRVEGKLVPLIRLHGRVRVAATGGKTGDVTVVVGLPLNEDFPLGRDRLAMCSSVSSRFEFWLPPGDYQFEVFGHKPPNLELGEPHPIKLTAGQREFDCGVLDLIPTKLKDGVEEAKKSGTWREFKQRYGQQCPVWHVVDARGMRKDVQALHFRGKWVLVYFWSPSCPPCLEKTLPKLREFYEVHKAQRDHFEIVSICIDLDGKMKTMADLDRRLKPIVQAVWGGKELPFPVLLDNSYKTMVGFGVEFFGAILLIDPTGRLVRGDELTLAAILEEGATGHASACKANSVDNNGK